MSFRELLAEEKERQIVRQAWRWVALLLGIGGVISGSVPAGLLAITIAILTIEGSGQ